MLKNAKSPPDAAQQKLRTNKATLNKKVSAFIGDLISWKQLMNGFPNKFNHEKGTIKEEIPADPGTIIGALLQDLNEIVAQSHSIIQEQINYSKTRRKKQPKAQIANIVPPTAATTTNTPATDLAKQLAAFEQKYQLVSEASNPISRFITRILTPRMGFGEAARIRQLRRTMLDACVQSYKDMKRLHNEIAKSSSASIVNSHKLVISAWNHWKQAYNIFHAYTAQRVAPPSEDGGKIDLPEEEKEEKEIATSGTDKQEKKLSNAQITKLKDINSDFFNFGRKLPTKTQPGKDSLKKVETALEMIKAAPKEYKVDVIENTGIIATYLQALNLLSNEFGVKADSFKDLAAKIAIMPVPEVQDIPDEVSPSVVVDAALTPDELLVQAQLKRWLGKARHQLLPGGTSGSRLEIYRLISTLRQDIDAVMNLLEKGLDEEKLSHAMTKVNKEMTSLRTMMRSLYFFEKPHEMPPAAPF